MANWCGRLLDVLKVIGNQRSGYVEVNEDITYGGTDYKTMKKNYRGEVLYNPEDGESLSLSSWTYSACH